MRIHHHHRRRLVVMSNSFSLVASEFFKLASAEQYRTQRLFFPRIFRMPLVFIFTKNRDEGDVEKLTSGRSARSEATRAPPLRTPQDGRRLYEMSVLSRSSREPVSLSRRAHLSLLTDRLLNSARFRSVRLSHVRSVKSQTQYA